MEDFFTIDVVYSESHMLFPKIVIGLLIIMGLGLLIPWLVKKIKNKESFSIKGKRFFEENYDKVKFWGGLALLTAWIFFLDKIGFIAASIIFMFLMLVLFQGKLKLKPIITSAAVSVVSTLATWLLFGVLFNITLP